jgi:alkanesulfonate monooxygenase SsuD/methylene tetrahydromethanopterin reductase-like flavin-dependent oxidoreductase (luciferase family)
MNVGLYFDLRNPRSWQRPWDEVYGTALELCEEADRGGISSLWFTEHHRFDDGYLPQPLTFAAAAAARTSRARIGTAVLVAPLRSAQAIAEEAAVVDILSGGRLDLGLGAGYHPREFELFGAQYKGRMRTTVDRVGEVRRAWDSGEATPRPLQDPLPIWLGFAGPRGARQAGEAGTGLLAINRELLEPYREGLLDGGFDPGQARMTGLVNGLLSEDPERDWPQIAPLVAHQWDSYRRYATEGDPDAVPEPIDVEAWRRRGIGGDHLERAFLLETPERAADRIREHLKGLPVETIFIWASIGGLAPELARRNVELASTRLAPLLAAD